MSNLYIYAVLGEGKLYEVFGEQLSTERFYNSTTLTTQQQSWQPDNYNNIVLLYAYVKIVRQIPL